MNKKIFSGIIFGILFGVFTYLVRIYDVAAVGPQGTEVGFSTVNMKFHELTGVNMFWYKLTQYFGALALLVCVFFALVGLIQWIRRKSLGKVDKEIIALGGLFVCCIAFYALFEKVVINYRPVIMPGETAPEASYPSSHTMLIIVVMGGTMMMIEKYVRNGTWDTVLKFICGLIIAATIGGRMYCGVHWLTDIVGGLLLGAAMLEIFAGVLVNIESGQYRRHAKHASQGL